MRACLFLNTRFDGANDAKGSPNETANSPRLCPGYTEQSCQRICNPRQSRGLPTCEGATVMEPITHQPHVNINERPGAVDDALTQIRDSLRGLRFGSVNIIVQDGVVIQIDRTEKRRLRVDRNNA